MKDIKSVDWENPNRRDLRKMDAAVAEHVFGRTVKWCADGYGSFSPYNIGPGGIVSPYAAHVEYAFEIVEATSAKGWAFLLKRENRFGLTDQYSCLFDRHDTRRFSIIARPRPWSSA